jgi:broad specificity phosphatase PhoE
MSFYFVRHAEILSNRKKIYAGASDEGLTLEGQRQAEEAARKLARNNFEVIYSSPLRRAVQTAEIIAKHHNRQVITEESFTEQRLGLWEGLSEEEIARDYEKEWQIWNKRPKELLLPGRETLHQLLDRVLFGIEQVRTKHPRGSIVVVTHVAIIRVVYLYLHNIDLNRYKSIAVENCSIFLMEGL